jgi:hypothetical protein
MANQLESQYWADDILGTDCTPATLILPRPHSDLSAARANSAVPGIRAKKVRRNEDSDPAFLSHTLPVGSKVTRVGLQVDWGYDQSALIDGLSVSSRNAAEPIPIGARKFQEFRLFGYVSHQDLTQSPSNGKESAMPSEEP